jgi:hypothetical protein
MMFGYILGILWTGLLTFMVITAYLHGDWKVGVDFNHFGEGYYELILFPTVMVMLILGMPMTVKWIMRD